MSATALLQKAAQMGSTASNASLLRGLGLAAPPPSSSGQDSTAMQWNGHGRAAENTLVTDGLGLRLPSGGSSGLMGQPMTRDLLGLGIGGGSGGASTRGLSALLNSFGGGFDVAYGGGGDSSPGDDKRKVQ
jgi:hypothetical protein